jgi:hypothetical protein
VKPPTFGDGGGGEGGVAGLRRGWRRRWWLGAAGGVGAVVAVSVWRICKRYAGNHGGRGDRYNGMILSKQLILNKMHSNGNIYCWFKYGCWGKFTPVWLNVKTSPTESVSRMLHRVAWQNAPSKFPVCHARSSRGLRH